MEACSEGRSTALSAARWNFMTFDIIIDGNPHRVELERTEASGGWRCRLDGRGVDVDVVQTTPDALSLLIEGRSIEVRRERASSDAPEGMRLAIRGRRFNAEVRDPRALRSRRAAAPGEGAKKVTAPMPGKIVRRLVEEGQQVEAGAALFVIEAMKMQNEIKAPKPGTVRQLSAVEGAPVNAGDVLAIIE
jgi:biotin carboxyl carrier protein